MTDIPKGYEAARRGFALADVGGLGRLEFRGPDSRKFLQGMLTGDVAGLQAGGGLPSCVLTPKGRLLALFWLYDRGEGFLSVQEAAATLRIREALGKALPLSRTELSDAAASGGAFYAAGPAAGSVLGRVLGQPPPALPCAGGWGSWRGERLWVGGCPIWGAGGFLILPPPALAAALWDALKEEGRAHGVGLLDAEGLETLRVEAGVPAQGREIGDDAYPLELGLEAAISFEKGCYMGQETTAHMKNRGHVNRRLVGLKLRAAAPAGSAVLEEGQDVGRVTSRAYSPRLGAHLALALVRAACAQPGRALQVAGSGGGTVAAEALELPLAAAPKT